MILLRQRRALVAMVALLGVLCLLLAAVHGAPGHAPVLLDFLLVPVFLFGLLLLAELPASGWSEAQLPAAPVRHSLRQRPPPRS